MNYIEIANNHNSIIGIDSENRPITIRYGIQTLAEEGENFHDEHGVLWIVYKNQWAIYESLGGCI